MLVPLLPHSVLALPGRRLPIPIQMPLLMPDFVRIPCKPHPTHPARVRFQLQMHCVDVTFELGSEELVAEWADTVVWLGGQVPAERGKETVCWPGGVV